MKSEGTDDFWRQYRKLPLSVRSVARRQYRLFRDNPQHPSLQFKHLQKNDPWYSARVSLKYRVVGLLVNETIVWAFIGSHAAYDRFLESLE